MTLNSLIPHLIIISRFLLLLTLFAQFQSSGSRALLKRESGGDDEFTTTTLDPLGKGGEDMDMELDNETFLTRPESPDPCALVLYSGKTVPKSQISLITISHSVFDVSRGVVPGVTYQVSVQVPVDAEFILEFWFNLSGTDEARTHFYPNSNNKKRRHRRDRRENQWIELSPADAPNQTAHQPFPCSRNAFGGIQNESSSPEDHSTSQVYTFNWFLKSNPFPSSTSANVVFRLRFRTITFVDSSVFEETLTTKVEAGCNLSVKVSDSESTKLTLSSLWNSQAENVGLNCTIRILPPPGFGLELKFSNLSVYGIRDLCKGRFLLFNSNNNPAEVHSSSLPFQLGGSDESPAAPFQYKYCGKIDHYSPEEMWLTFPSTKVISSAALNSSRRGIHLRVDLPGYIKPKETFSMEFHSISPCHKVLLSNLSGGLEYERSDKLSSGESLCSIVIHVPFGNTINAELRVVTPELEYVAEGGGNRSDANQAGRSSEGDNVDGLESKEFECILNSRKPTVVTEGRDGDQYFIFRVEELGQPESHESDVHHRVFCLRRRRSTTTGVTLERRWKSAGNRIKITFSLDQNFPHFELSYRGESVAEIRRECDEGWVHVKDAGCVMLMESWKSWTGAEMVCQENGGHLATVMNDLVQQKLQQIITNSASYRPGSAYWIGANDRESEGNFQWTSGLPFTFTNWFPGWSKTNSSGHVNAQPNDDGLSGQDCVELRQEFAPKSSSSSSFRNGGVKELLPIIFPRYSSTDLQSSSNEAGKGKRKSWPHKKVLSKSTFHWNDRNCQTLNFFLCERRTHPGIEYACNRTVRLGPGPTQVSSLTVTSPAFPNPYPDNTLCITRVETAPGYRIVANFAEFHLEDSPYCKYDSLELIDAEDDSQGQSNGSMKTKKGAGKRFCGDWSRRLKLLTFTSATSNLNFKFESDFSHTFPGFKAIASTEKVIPRLSYDEQVEEQCLEQHMQAFGSNCYLVVSSPATTWEAAHQTCQSFQASLTSIVTLEEWRFVTQILVSSPDYQKKFNYWVGGFLDQSNQLVWKDQMPFNFSVFHPSDLQSISEWKCLSLYWHEGGKGTFAWRLSNCNQLSGYICKKATKVEFRPDLNRTFVGIGGKLTSPNFPSNYQNNLDYSTKLSSPPGTLIVLQFVHLDIETQDECLYDHVQIIDRKTSRSSSRICGIHSGKDLERFDFVSTSNAVEVIFHSDFSEVMRGFEIIWRAVDVTECISGRTIVTGLGNGFPLHQGSIHSPNFPYFNLPNLNCVYTIVAPAGQRIWFHFDIFEVGEEGSREEVEEIQNSLAEERTTGNRNCVDEDHVVVDLWSDTDSPGFANPKQSRKLVVLCGNLTMSPHRTSFVSYGERIQIRLITRQGRRGRGFLAKFKSLPGLIKEKLVVQANPNSSFLLSSINYPFQPPPEVNFTMELTSPPNYIITLQIRGVASPNCHVTASTYIIIHDPYVGSSSSGASWTICQPDVFPFEGESVENRISAESAEMSNNVFVRPGLTDMLVSSRNVLLQAASPIEFQSTFNRLELTQIYMAEGPRSKWNTEAVVSLDDNFRAKVLSGGDRLLLLNACTPNPCLNGGKCVTDGDRHICRCPLPFTGPFCGLSVCDLSPCLFGDCVVEQTSYRCHCHMGYAGENCDKRSKPCMRDGKEDKCTGHGECIEVNDITYKCRCHAFWEGPRCEGRMQNIPYVPLSERMLKEPFWLGIITVTVVLGVIGLVWCLKRHFPEKLEKFLNDDLDRNRRISWVSARSPSSFRVGGGCSYHGVREPIPSTSQQATSPQTARSFLGRFGIRKPSLLSLSSATSVSAATTSPHTYENRTFSLDDLLRPSRSSMMRTPSPRSRRNFSIHSRRDPVEKQQILQQLVSSGASVSFDGTESKPTTPKPKPTIAEIIQMSEKRLRLANVAAASASSSQNQPSTSFSIFMDKAVVENETSFSNVVPPYPSTAMSAASKAEKKVTFARLLDKLTAHDMSSSSSCSDLSCAEENSTRTIMVNPRPPKKDRKGRLKRSKAFAKGRNSETDQDGFEMSSSDTTPDPIYPPRFPSRACVSPTGLSVSANNSPSFKTPGKSLPKMASADSLLALFRRFSGSANNSAPPSPQYSENEESSAGATPLSTPSSPRNSSLSLNIRPPAFLITTPETSTDASASPGHDQFSSPGGAPGSWRPQAQNMSVISLEVPMREHCLSPIHEVPTPLPTPSHSPAHSPMMHRLQSSEPSAHAQGLPMIKLQASSEAEEEDGELEVTRNAGFPLVIPKIAVSVEGEEGETILTDSEQQSTPPSVDAARQRKARSREIEPIPDVLIHVQPDPSSQSACYAPSRFTFDDDDMARVERRLGYTSDSTSPSKTRPPPLFFANEIMSDVQTLPFLKEEKEVEDGKEEGSMNIPLVNVENPTPIGTPDIPTMPSPMPLQTREYALTGKSAPVTVPPDITAFAVMVSPRPWEVPFMHQHAHWPLIPPTIMINQNFEAESDSDTTIRKLVRKPNLAFLSPFAGASDRVPSESNLSTSGYSSMASPCHSRCPSVSPLCPDTDEYHGAGHHFPRRSSLITPCSSRKSSLTMTPRRCSLNATSPLVSSNLLGMGSGLGMEGVSSFGESTELIEMEIETDSALDAETDPEVKLKENRDLTEEFISLANLLQVPRKNLPKSHSLDMDVGGQSLPTPKPTGGVDDPAEKRGHSQSIHKGESLDSKLNSVSSDPSKLDTLLSLHLSKLHRSRSGSQGLGEERNPEGKRLMGSRSDSSMSELSTGGMVGGFTSPMTDSDVYDCASSEVQSGATSRDLRKSYANSSYLSPSQQIRRSGRRRNRRRMSSSGAAKKSPGFFAGSATVEPFPSETQAPEEETGATAKGPDDFEIKPIARSHPHLLGTLSIGIKKTPTSSSSPKRRVRAQTNLDVTSSSSESLNSLRSSRSRMSSPLLGSPKQAVMAAKGPGEDAPPTSESGKLKITKLERESGDVGKNKTGEVKSPSSPGLLEGRTNTRDSSQAAARPPPDYKIPRSRLKTISLQIRFLRRLERNLLRKKERLNKTRGRRQGERDETSSWSSNSTCSTCSTTTTSSTGSTSEEDGSHEGGQSSFEDQSKSDKMERPARPSSSPPPLSSSLQSLSLPLSSRIKRRRK